VLRGEETGRCCWPHQILWSSTTPADADAAAGGAIIDLLRELDVLIETSAQPRFEATQRRAGVRESRLAKITGVDEAHRVDLELAPAAGLIASGIPIRNDGGDRLLGRRR